jgi:ring-1,2-phenylacetyl-CoA epoxidase subunit PaaC
MAESRKQEALVDYMLHLADNTLILGHRNSEWTGHGPILEQDIALSNIALDLIGQARNCYQYAAGLINAGNGSIDQHATEDTLAYLRNPDEFKNLLLVEQDNGDWGKTITRQFLFSTYQFFLYRKLSVVKDLQLAAIAEKSLKEITYHLRWSAEWMIRLGDGTTESKARMQHAVNELWKYTGECFVAAGYENLILQQEKISLEEIKKEWDIKITQVMTEATLDIPAHSDMAYGGKDGKHSAALVDLLSEMQYLQRTYPGNEW